MGGIFCILHLHVNLKIHLCIFNHHITIKAISLKDIVSLWLQCSMTSFNTIRCFNAIWRGAFYILMLVLEKLLLLFKAGFEFGYSFLTCWWARFRHLHINLNKFALNSRVAFNGLRYSRAHSCTPLLFMPGSIRLIYLFF